MGKYRGGRLRGWAESLAREQGSKPPTPPHPQGQDQSQAADAALAAEKLREQEARRQAELQEQEAKQRQEQQEQEKERLRLQQQEAERARRQQEAELQRQADAERERMLGGLQEVEAPAPAPASQSNAPTLVPPPVTSTESIPRDSLNRDAAAESAIKSPKKAVGEELAYEEPTRAEAEATHAQPEEASPGARLAKARAKAEQTAAAFNAFMRTAVDTARKWQANKSPTTIDPGKAETKQHSYTAPPPPVAKKKGIIPRNLARPTPPSAPAQFVGPKAPTTASSRSYAAPPGKSKVPSRAIKGSKLPLEEALRIVKHLEAQRLRKLRPASTPVRETSPVLPSGARPGLEKTWEKLRTELNRPRVTNAKKLAAVSKLPRPKPGSSPPPPTRPPRETDRRLERIELVKEGKRKGDDYLYESGAKGHQEGIVPRLRATDGEIVVTAKFDGRDELVMIDRKISLKDNSATRWLMLRQSLVAEANGFTLRWEVPNARHKRTVLRIISKLGLNNVDVAICK